MGAYYDEIEIEDMAWDAEERYPYTCVVYDPLDYEEDVSGEEEDEEESDSSSGDEQFEDALENFHIADEPERAISVTAWDDSIMKSTFYASSLSI
ncbi:hypothetical protein Agabi119p4_6085 [Agaricus bisporus var. burnettii]|uniref:Uncharacterized protein n=1 Tax=Agaricus bisporus var. burnettii TaxID=192524 RepID=A0A8H7F167_AGABI|nr:hypothetical protein Agabi119p4_6085 [Agaricus bisporus var. burnettii]